MEYILVSDIDNTLKEFSLCSLLEDTIVSFFTFLPLIQKTRIVPGMPLLVHEQVAQCQDPAVYYLSNGMHTTSTKIELQRCFLPGKFLSRDLNIFEAFKMALPGQAKQYKLRILQDLWTTEGNKKVVLIGNHGVCVYDRVDVDVYIEAVRRWPRWVKIVLIRTDRRLESEVIRKFGAVPHMVLGIIAARREHQGIRWARP